jgi:hypothetical protein
MSANTLLWGLSAILMLLTTACALYLQEWIMVAVATTIAGSATAQYVASARRDRSGSSPPA